MKEALDVPPVDEYTAEELDLLKFGVNLERLSGFKKKHPDKKTFHNGRVTNLFLGYYLNSANTIEIRKLNENKAKFTDVQQDTIEVFIGNLFKEKQEIIYAGDSQKRIKELLDIVEKLQEENEELQETLQKSLNTMGLSETTNQMQEELLKEADNFLESLRWLYDLMMHMDFCNIEKVKEKIEETIHAGKESIDQDDVLKWIRENTYKVSKEEMIKIKEIEEVLEK